MYRILIIPFFFLLMCTSQAQDTLQIDKDKGIFGFVLGTASEDIPVELVYQGKGQKMKRFRPEPEPTEYERVPVQSVRLSFFHGNLHSIVVKTEDDKSAKKFIEKMDARYGPGTEQDIFKSQIYWQGKRVTLLYMKNSLMGTGDFTFIDRKVHRDYEIFLHKKKYGE